MTIREVLEAAAVEAGVAGEHADDGSVSWSVRGRGFAALDATGSVAWFRLDPVLAEAARRTPSTRASERGAEWVGFSPDAIDDRDRDRAAAWFAAAVRRASA